MTLEPVISQQTSRYPIATGILFVILALAPTTCVLQGVHLYSAEKKASPGEYFYVPFTQAGDRDYMKVGSYYFFSGVVGITAFAYLSFGKRRLYKTLAILGLVGAFVVRMVPAISWATPEFDRPIHAQYGVSRTMEQSYSVLLESAKTSGHFPHNEGDLQKVVHQALKPASHSHYARGSNKLPYKFVFVQGASGPHFPEPPGPAPGVIYCAISSDHKKLWLTGTVLWKLVDDRVYFLPGAIFLDYNLKHAGSLDGKAYLAGKVPSP